MNRQAVADNISENKFDTIKTDQITAPTQASVQTNHCSPLSDRNSLFGAFGAAGHKSSLLTETGQMFAANIEAPPRHSKRLLEKRSRSVAAKPNYTVPAESPRRPGRQTGKQDSLPRSQSGSPARQPTGRPRGRPPKKINNCQDSQPDSVVNYPVNQIQPGREDRSPTHCWGSEVTPSPWQSPWQSPWSLCSASTVMSV